MNSKIFRQELPKLYHLNNEFDSDVNKSDDKQIIIRKLVQLSPVSTSKLNQNNSLNQIKSETQDEELISDKEIDCKMSELENIQESKEDSEELKFKKPDENLNLATLLEVINELKSNKSRVTKLSVEKALGRRNTNLNKNEINEFISKCINDDIIEKVKYRDYYGLRMKAAFKRTSAEEPDDDANESGTEESSQNDPINDKESNVDNLSECSSVNNNNLNEELDEELDSSYNTKKNALKRCSPTIRYLLRTSNENGVSAADILKSLQAKRLLILYDVKKFTWLMKTYFVDKGIYNEII